jgi:hypothetical protein
VLHHWFRRGDQKIHESLLSARFGDEFVAPVEPAQPNPRGFEEPIRDQD